MTIIIKRLAEDTIDDFLHFFDDRAFCDNPEWAGCYCHFFYIPDDEVWLKRSKNENRRDSILRIKEGRLNGFLAYLDGVPAGWCNADAVTNYPRIVGDRHIEIDNDRKTGSVVCFTIDPQHRKKGIAGKLLETACRHFQKAHYDCIEAYPRKAPKTDADNYYGPLPMFLSQDFKIHQTLDEFYIVRKQLRT